MATALLVSACGSSGSAEPETAVATGQPTTTVSSTTHAPTTTAVATTTTTSTTLAPEPVNPWPPVGDELAAQLGCGPLTEESPLVESDWLLLCDSVFAPETMIVLFGSNEQQMRYLSYYAPSQLVVGHEWLLSTPVEPFSSVDEVALAVEGVVVKRTSVPSKELPKQAPLSTEDVPEQAINETALSYLDALALAEAGDPQTAIPMFDQVIAHLPELLTGEVAVLRAVALFNRGAAYERLADAPWTSGVAALVLGEAELSYEWLSNGYEGSAEAEVHRVVTMGLYRWGYVLVQRGEFDLAVARFDEAIRRGTASDDPEQDFYVAESMFFRALALADLGDLEGAILGLEALISAFETSPNPDILPIIVDAQDVLPRIRAELG